MGLRLKVGLPLIGPEGKCNEFWVFLLKPLQTMTSDISWELGQTEPIHLASIYLKLASNLALNHGSGLILDQQD